jgi:hypothetical protein
MAGTMDVLHYIKRLVISGSVEFTQKALDEMEVDGLTPHDVLESIVNAKRITKTLRSTSVARRSSGERLYVIKSFNYEGTLIYTKGSIIREEGFETFYILVSAKGDTDLQ